MAKLTFWGGAKSVTGANYLLEHNGTRILIDCGLAQGSYVAEQQNFEDFPYNPTDITALFITHAHIDHTGRIPKLYKDGFQGTTYSTKPTRDFAKHLLLDSEDILRREAEEQNKPPLYDKQHVAQTFRHWKSTGYHHRIRIKDISLEFFDAGHILGSAFIAVTLPDNKRIIFSGDLGNTPNPLLNDIEPIGKATHVLIESTYGGRIHEPVNQRTQLLEQIIEETIQRNGVLMIPAFAMERTQQLLYQLNGLVEQKRIPPIPVFIDSPLAIKLTTIYKKYSQDSHYFDQQAITQIQQGDAIFNFPRLYLTRTSRQSRAINKTNGSKIIIAGSGMSNGGRIQHHERRYLPDPHSTILFIGYQAKHSLGREIIEGAKTVSIFGDPVQIRCHVQAIGGYSAHADQPKLLEWMNTATPQPQQIFVVQGEEDQADILAEKINSDLNIQATVPSHGNTIEL